MFVPIALFLLLLADLRSSQAACRAGRNGAEVGHLAKFYRRAGESTWCRRDESDLGERRRTESGAQSIKLFTEEAAFTVDPQFLSVTLGIGKMQNDWAAVNFSAPRVINAAKALSPAMLRLGGTRADFLTFNLTQAPSEIRELMGTHFVRLRMRTLSIIKTTSPTRRSALNSGMQ